jgi:zinc ribbon protein
MSASAPAAEPCPNCGAGLPPFARFCPACGSQVDEGGETMRAEVPPTETGEVPVAYERAQPRWFGVAPPNLLLGLAVVALVLAIVLFATGHWPYGLILLGLGALLAAAFLEAVRRRPERPLGRRSAFARERAQSTLETWRARSYAAAEVRRIRSGLFTLDGQRRNALYDLGAAVHAGDATAETAARGRLAELEAEEAELRARLDGAVESADERIRLARLPVEETMMVLPTEPTPPPGEADPPQPATVPEPYPPPDEGTPPQPARIPEPSPGAPEKD